MVDGFSAGGSVLSASHTTSQCKAPRRRSRRRAPASHRAGVLGVQRPFIDDGAVPPRLTLLPPGASAGRTSIALWMNPLGVVPGQVVRPGLLGGWGLSRPPSPRRTPDGDIAQQCQDVPAESVVVGKAGVGGGLVADGG